jgi:hypothetical protein
VKRLSASTILLASLGISGVITGCGAVSGGVGDDYYKVGNSSASAITASNPNGTTTIQGYSCPNSPNVTPMQNNTTGANNQFTVCTSSTPGQIFITGTTTTSNQICVFPVLSSNNIGTPVLNTQIQCPFATGNGVTLSYAGINFNAVAIVEAPFAVQMYNCLANGGQCPNYAYGTLPGANSSPSTSPNTQSSPVPTSL